MRSHTIVFRSRLRSFVRPDEAGRWLLVLVVSVFFSLPILAQDSDSKGQPVVVRPGAPGQETRILPTTTRPALPPHSVKDKEFMQGMIMHHAQAVEMTDMIAERTKDKEIRLLGAKISQSQTDEMNFMRRWLEARGESIEMVMPKAEMAGSHSHGSHSSGSNQMMLMPGMLSSKQMNALKMAKGIEFDRLFLAGMIQHHDGALVMVKDLFESAGAGQDAELFNFASDVDSGQRAEIAIMRNLLNGRIVKEKL